MKGRMCGWLAAMAVCAGSMRAGTLEGMRSWAAEQGAAAAAQRLRAWGLTNATDAAAVLAWEEAETVDRALAAGAYGLIYEISRRDALGPESVEKIRQAMLSEPEPPRLTIGIVRNLPRQERQAFAELLYAAVPVSLPDRPVYGRHLVRHLALGDGSFYSSQAGVEEFAELLLAAEAMDLKMAEDLKIRIRDRAVDLARRKLREDGKSFVMQNGVNPLAEAIRPVVDALNAPLCEGLEGALRGLGADVAEQDRAELVRLAGEWQERLLWGELTDVETRNVLGKVAVALGVEGFNALVEVYNHGTGERDAQ